MNPNINDIPKRTSNDPTMPIALSNEEDFGIGKKYILESIIIGPFRKLAIINGVTLGVGSSIDGARVLAIAKDHVLLLMAGNRKLKIFLFGGRLWKRH
jgi:hypothetical protein